jgi:hypothetical protein
LLEIRKNPENSNLRTLGYDSVATSSSVFSFVRRSILKFDFAQRRDAVQSRMGSGIGIEDHAKLKETRGKKISVFPSR